MASRIPFNGRLLNEGVSQFPGYVSRVELSLSEIDQAVMAARDGVEAAGVLARLSNSPSDAVQATAVAARQTIQRMISPEHDEGAGLLKSPLFETGRQIDTGLRRLRSIVHHPFDRVGRLMQPSWTLTGLVLTFVIATLIVAQAWWAATYLLAARVGMSVIVGDNPNLPYEGPVRSNTARGVVYRCLAGHFSDIVLLAAVALVLQSQGRGIWALFTLLSALIMVLATLLRVSSLQVGVQIYRLTLERVVRLGGILAGLLLTASGVGPWVVSLAFAEPALPGGRLSLSALVLPGLACAAYGAGEVWRTVRRLKHADVVYGGVPHISIVVSGPPTEQHPGGVYDTLRSCAG